MQALTILSRGLHLAGMLSFLGTVGFRCLILTAAASVPEALRRRLVRLGAASVALAVVAGLSWLVAEAASMADAGSAAEAVRAVPMVVTGTRFGQMLALRLVLLLVALPFTVVRSGPWGGSAVAFGLAVIATALQGLMAHAGAASGDSLLMSEALHLPAAGIWLGALLPLWLAIGGLEAADGAAVCERFTPIGIACVLTMGATGVIQALSLVGDLPHLLGTTYGQIILLKLGLFLTMLVLALLNRLWLTDRLVQGGGTGLLRLSVGTEAVLGFAVILAAGWLASSTPALHDQPVWPLSWQFSLVTVNEDDDLRQEVIVSLLLIGLAVVALVGASFSRWLRWVGVAVLLAVLAWRGPALALLTVPAYPTSFQTSPTGFGVDSIVAGQRLFAANCVSCHGPDGRGDGPAASGLSDRPADLTAGHVLEHPDGEMIWWMLHGIPDPDSGQPMMPGFAGRLSENAMWSLIDYVRAHNAGAAVMRGAMPAGPMRAPDFALTCRPLPASDLADLRGHALLILAGAAAGKPPPVPPQDEVSTLTIALRAGADVPPTDCVAQSDAAWDAYAILGGTPPQDLAGATFLIDPNGWLRAVHWPDAAGGWHTDAELITLIRNICTSPLAGGVGGAHEHHH